MPQAPPPKRSVAAVVIACVAGFLAVLGIAGTVTGFVLYSGEKNKTVPDTDNALRQAACDYMTLFGTYDYTDFEKNKAALMDASTEDFRKTYSGMVNGIKDSVVSQQLHSKVTESHCGVLSVGDHRAQVLVSTKQATSKPSDPDIQTRLLMMTVSLEEQPDGRWLVGDVKPIV
ncbi:hypothetical protein ACFXHA_32050 [Nocardia sp. NPDC059240]|uniref:hypothetical protein n=1 Tax=Nocardia sp. NPDC059240 TaxID=3346786 RepID=UPI0036B6238C